VCLPGATPRGRDSGDYAAAEAHYREALKMAKNVDYAERVATYTGNLADVSLNREDWPEAEKLAREALPLAESVERQELIAADCPQDCQSPCPPGPCGGWVSLRPPRGGNLHETAFARSRRGAEALALIYASAKAGWVVKRRLQRGESADWPLSNDDDWLALEVSGVTAGGPAIRLKEKVKQVARCSLPVERLAVVVAFDRPLIMARSAL